MTRSIIVLAALGTSIGCATLTPTQKRAVLYSGIGAAGGAIGGSMLSPNDESRALNTLVFGLTGALTGSLIASLGPSSREPSGPSGFRDRLEEQAAREFSVYPNGELPDFLKNRIQPVVVEEYVESDQVSEDGTLHEPHKVYRIKQPAELYARPPREPKAPKGPSTRRDH